MQAIGEQDLYAAAFDWYAANEEDITALALSFVSPQVTLEELLSYSLDVIAQSIRRHDAAKGPLRRYLRVSLKWYFNRYRTRTINGLSRLRSNEILDWNQDTRYSQDHIDATIDLQYAFDRVESSEANSSAVVVLYDLYNCTFEEIGKYLGCSTATARTRYAEALAKIKHAVCAG